MGKESVWCMIFSLTKMFLLWCTERLRDETYIVRIGKLGECVLGLHGHVNFKKVQVNHRSWLLMKLSRVSTKGLGEGSEGEGKKRSVLIVGDFALSGRGIC